MTQMGLRRKSVLELLHIFILGESVLVWGELSNYIIAELDLTKLEPDEDSMFPIFDLCAVDAHETPLTRAIRHKSDIVTGYNKRYLDLFEQFTKLKLRMKHHKTAALNEMFDHSESLN